MVNIGLLIPTPMPPELVAIADRLRTTTSGVTAVIVVDPTPTLDLLRGALRPVKRWAGSLREGAPNARRAAVIATDAYARRHGLRHLRVPAANHRRTAEVLSRGGFEVVVAASVGILRPVLLDAAGVTFLNAHAGRLPGYGGMNVVEWQVFNDAPVYGTIHRIDAGIDTGEILLQAPLELGRPKTIDELSTVAFRRVWEMMGDALRDLERGARHLRRQPEGERVQWFRMHPELRKVVQRKLDDGTFFAIQERCREAGTPEPGR